MAKKRRFDFTKRINAAEKLKMSAIWIWNRTRNRADVPCISTVTLYQQHGNPCGSRRTDARRTSQISSTSWMGMRTSTYISIQVAVMYSAGLAIYNQLKRYSGHKVGYVDGMAASIASVIMFACDELHFATGAQAMIHKPLCMAWGNADDFKEVIKQLDLCEDSILDVYEEHLKEGVTRDKIKSFMAKEKWFSGAELAEYFDVLIDEKAAVAACASDYFENTTMFRRASKEQPQGHCRCGACGTGEQEQCSSRGRETENRGRKAGYSCRPRHVWNLRKRGHDS